jgi:hypothetical protein
MGGAASTVPAKYAMSEDDPGSYMDTDAAAATSKLLFDMLPHSETRSVQEIFMKTVNGSLVFCFFFPHSRTA